MVDYSGKRRLQLFGHVVRLESNVPAHRALWQAICVRGNIRPETWLHHIAGGSPFGIRTEWHRELPVAVTGSLRCLALCVLLYYPALLLLNEINH